MCYNAQIEAELPHSYKFTEAELEYAADNFEQSPVAALAFLAANTGIASTPEDLGPLLDGVPDPSPTSISASSWFTIRALNAQWIGDSVCLYLMNCLLHCDQMFLHTQKRGGRDKKDKCPTTQLACHDQPYTEAQLREREIMVAP